MKTLFKIIAIFEVTIGFVLLASDAYDYVHLYSIHDNIMSGLVDFVRYKEDTYSSAFLWMILFIAGISYWLNKKVNWILTEAFLIALLLIFIFDIVLSFDLNVAIFILLITSVAVFSLIQYVMLKYIKQAYLYSLKTILISIATGVLIVAVYLWIDNYLVYL